jgi:cell division protein FtsB
VGKLLRFPRRGKGKDAGAKPLFPGLVPGGTDARPAYFASDASAAPGAKGTPEPALERKLKRRRRGAIAVFAAIFIAGSLAALFAERGLFDVRRKRAELAEKKAEVEELQARVNLLRAEVERLQSDPAASERIAREDLGYAADGEILILLPDDLDATERSAIVPPASSTTAQ